MKFLALFLFNIAYLCINILFCYVYYVAIYLINILKIPKIEDTSLILFLTFAFILFVWIAKFLLFPFLLTIGSKIKYTKNCVKNLENNIIDKTSTIIQALIFDGILLLGSVIYGIIVDYNWFTLVLIIFILCGGGVLPAYLSLSFWSFFNKDNI